MMLRSIVFDSENQYWNDDTDSIMLVLRNRRQCLNDLLKLRGYVYLNQICETLGVKWNPEDENICVKYNEISNTIIDFSIIKQSRNSYQIHIMSLG